MISCNTLRERLGVAQHELGSMREGLRHDETWMVPCLGVAVWCVSEAGTTSLRLSALPVALLCAEQQHIDE